MSRIFVFVSFMSICVPVFAESGSRSEKLLAAMADLSAANRALAEKVGDGFRRVNARLDATDRRLDAVEERPLGESRRGKDHGGHYRAPPPSPSREDGRIAALELQNHLLMQMVLQQQGGQQPNRMVVENRADSSARFANYAGGAAALISLFRGGRGYGGVCGQGGYGQGGISGGVIPYQNLNYNYNTSYATADSGAIIAPPPAAPVVPVFGGGVPPLAGGVVPFGTQTVVPYYGGR